MKLDRKKEVDELNTIIRTLTDELEHSKCQLRALATSHLYEKKHIKFEAERLKRRLEKLTISSSDLDPGAKDIIHTLQKKLQSRVNLEGNVKVSMIKTLFANPVTPLLSS